MFGTPFYFSLIRKYVILTGTLFNNIRITRSNSSGNQTALIKVPITYAPKDKMLARVIQDTALDRQTATIPLPAISFEMGKMSYDGSRKLNTIGRSSVKNTTNPSKFKYRYNPVPYNIEFKVYIYAKNAEDGTKIVEQILPYFTPDWTTTVSLIPEMEITVDVPITLNNISYSDNYDGDFKERRAIIWTLDLVLKGYLYGPVRQSGIIKFINTNFYIPDVEDGKLSTAVGSTPLAEKVTIQPGLSANGNPINYYGAPNPNTGTVPYVEIEADDDFGFITQIYGADEYLMSDEKDDDPIGKALGLTPIEKTTEVISSMLTEAHNDSAKNDFEIARANIHGMLENGNDAMAKLAQIADSSQHPRAFEVLAKLMDTMLVANEKLLDLQTKIREIDSSDAPVNEKAKSITNNLFVGSTAELQKVLKDMKKNGDVG